MFRFTDDDNEFIATNYAGYTAVRRGFMNMNGSTETTTILVPEGMTVDQYIEDYDINLYNADDYHPDYNRMESVKALLLRILEYPTFIEAHTRYGPRLTVNDKNRNEIATHFGDEFKYMSQLYAYVLGLVLLEVEKPDDIRKRLLKPYGRS